MAQATTDRLPFAFSDFVPCANGGAGEVVDISGVVNVVEHTGSSASGSTQHTAIFSAHGSAVGQTTGNGYTFNSQSRDLLLAAGDGTPLSAAFAFKAQLIGEGAGSNQWLSGNVHIVINSNGDLTASVNNFRVECR